VKHVCASKTGFTAVKEDNSVVIWGEVKPVPPVETMKEQFDRDGGVKEMYCSGSAHARGTAFAALTWSGSVVAWGDSDGGDCNDVKEQLAGDVKNIFPLHSGFAAVKADGSLVTWPTRIPESLKDQVSSGVQYVCSSEGAISAGKDNGQIISWGNFRDDGYYRYAEVQSGPCDEPILQICSARGIFAALKADGSVDVWRSFGGGQVDAIEEDLAGVQVQQICATGGAFAFLKSDGSVLTTWAYMTKSQLKQLKGGVKQIYANLDAFVALKTDGSVVAWGGDHSGGAPEEEGVHEQLSGGVQLICKAECGFAALKMDGSVVSWGSGITDGFREVEEHLAKDVQQVFASWGAFAAVKLDGSVVTWGQQRMGGFNVAVSKDELTMDRMSTVVVY